MQYKSVFIEPDGSQGVAMLEAADTQELHAQLGRQGRLLIKATSNAEQKGNRSKFKGHPITDKKLLIFTQSMESAMDAGVPVLTALDSILDQETDEKHRQVYEEIKEQIAGGKTLAESLASMPRTFSKIYGALVHAGESSGSLPISFATLGSFLEWKQDLQATARQAMIYPFIVISAAYGLILFLLGFVIPGLSEVIAKLGADELPLASRILIQVSEIISNHMLTVFLGSVAIVVAMVLALRSEVGRQIAAGIAVRMPVIGHLVITFNMAQFSSIISSLLKAGMTFLESIDLVKPTLSLPSLQKSIQATRDRIIGGSKITEALEATAMMPPVALSMIRVGEESGNMPKCFERLGTMYNREVKASVKRALGYLEPVITIILGVIIGGVAAVIITTLYTAVGGLGR